MPVDKWDTSVAANTLTDLLSNRIERMNAYFKRIAIYVADAATNFSWTLVMGGQIVAGPQAVKTAATVGDFNNQAYVIDIANVEGEVNQLLCSHAGAAAQTVTVVLEWEPI